MNSFYLLKVSQIRALTSNAVELKFEIPAELYSKFNFIAGQYITIKHQIGGEEVRRSYSICSSIKEGISVGVKKVETGKMSSFLTTKIKEGDVLEVMPPTGNFVLQGKNVVGICAGSGITPILSMIKTILLNNQFFKKLVMRILSERVMILELLSRKYCRLILLVHMVVTCALCCSGGI